MVTRQRALPHRPGPVRLGVASAVVVSAFACNALLGNEPRELAPSHSAGGASGEGSSSRASGAGPGGPENATAGEGGTSARPGGGHAGENATTGEGAAGNGAGGDSVGQGAAGESATGHGAAGEAGDRGDAGTGGRAPDPCELATVECSNGDVDDAGSAPCGHCGTEPMIRLCRDTCSWGDPVPNGACTGEGCAPKDTGTQTVNCPCGGTKKQIQTCSDACTWGPWMDTTTCDVSCCTTVVYCDTQSSSVGSMYPGRGTWCRQETTACSATEAYADCLAAADSVCGGVEPSLFMEYH